jgi:DNA modification methylase
MNTLYYGDNLDVLSDRVATESVDLIYLDPPFNSNRSYNVLFKAHGGEESQAQIEAFDDSWHWSQETEAQYAALVAGGAPIKVSEAIEAMHGLLGPNDVLAYLVMMTARLVELHRVLKPTGTLYLHCDPTASHYLRDILDAIFGADHQQAEIIWKRTTAHSDGAQGRRRLGRVHDVIHVYAKGSEWTWNPIFTPYDQSYIDSHYNLVEEGTNRRYQLDNLTAARPGGDTSYEWHGARPYPNRYWAYSKEKMAQFESDGRLVYTKTGMPRLKRYLDEMPGVPLQDIWTDIFPINSQAKERLGYQTQKPLALLERILMLSSNEGDVVLDPFCGCGTTVDAAQKLQRRWIGIDITYLAVDLIRKRLRHTYGDEIEDAYEVHGIPTDTSGAQALFGENPFDFERWAVSLVDGQPNEKQVGDKGVDGRIRFHADKDNIGTVIVSVKGGGTNPNDVQALVGAVGQHKADMGLFIMLNKPTKGMMEVVDHSGTYTVPMTGTSFPKVQIVTIAELLAKQYPKIPTAILPYIKASPKAGSEPISLF